MPMTMDAAPRAPRARAAEPAEARELVLWCAALACMCVAAAQTSSAEDWQPIGLVLALCAMMVLADVLPVTARRIRMSAGLMVQVVAMALLGPAPAVAIGVISTITESIVNRVTLRQAFMNILLFAFLGLVGGIAFDALRGWLDLGHRDTAYALLVMPTYFALAMLNLGLVTAYHPGVRSRILRDSGLPSLPLELLSGLMAGATVLVWAHAGLAAAAALLVVLVITIPLVRSVGDALMRSDDLAVLQHVSDQRAAEVARLSTDRERLLSEVLDAEQRERARLAESLHDGPMQRLVALRQDVAEADDGTRRAIAQQVHAAIAETRAIISSFHPATVREMGFEASLRAAVAPFPAARTVTLSIRSEIDDRALEGSLLVPIAQELVVNAVKHAAPTAVRVVLEAQDNEVVLEVDDDGVGIDDAASRRAVQAGHLGLAMVRRRVEDLGGRLEIATRPDGGTHSRVVLPARLG
jgi:signal transduction histidine kinase